jgi:hypothetical protein
VPPRKRLDISFKTFDDNEVLTNVLWENKSSAYKHHCQMK